MGKTNPTYRDTVRAFETEWSTYHRALRTQHQDQFQQLIHQVRNFADAGGMQNHPDPMTTHLISMLLAHECRLTELELQLENPRSDPAITD
ncbi:hypothetical protein Halru_0289 [Halovivax ruber XH-70]|uniref:DUF8156 domain-containing protein n=1 Tax=Halovivax ruber (strain DSM 18193 / JCM 13892 / XH-70) TaxID=797302 RepID=L0I5Y4_HALRX|nr:hypothetical protein [Halovivax ruber]AGB14935.1 hypothetical protein Halru_0289 [Halovivax ruber XH-70]